MPVCPYNTKHPGNPGSCFMAGRMRGGGPERLDSSTGPGEIKRREKNAMMRQGMEHDPILVSSVHSVGDVLSVVFWSDYIRAEFLEFFIIV